MYTMFDILQSQGDASVQAFGQQFGLTPEQTRRAMEALLPALSMGIQRNAGADPMGFGRLFGLAQPGRAQPPAGADMLAGLFGSPMIAQAVIQQASAASGVGAQALRQMLPIMAGMIVAGIVHLLLNAPAPAPAAEPPPSPYPVGTLWTDWLNGLSAAAAQMTPSASPSAPPPERRATGRKPEAAPLPDATKASMEVIQQMLQTGAEVQEQNVKAMKEVFEAFWSQPKPEAQPSGTGEAPASSPTTAPGKEGASASKRKPGSRN
ncbi:MULTISPECIES: DUF937 domain-containing protein [Methylorubrum]|jgi:hypothetical protein|nr:DUF937 domain-containing protein [Methylorubrum sp. DB1722]MBI1688149.1 DUF937 domain-containing protein [Methylorubrum sp. DB1722]MBK3406354.1 DUF937 domain-containing protein [Methylorubrum rhodesianum]MBY0143152.1 DUF937 domain-containing protein [Methylorubrum populi]MRI56730.1 DUF937 domain-containing protein [Methylobacterium sp. DB1607]